MFANGYANSFAHISDKLQSQTQYEESQQTHKLRVGVNVESGGGDCGRDGTHHDRRINRDHIGTCFSAKFPLANRGDLYRV